MQKFNKVKGIPAYLPIVNIDTDMLIPKQFLKTIKRTGLGKNLFYEMRYDEKGIKNDQFILTHPNISLPENCTYYSVNYGNWNEFSLNTKSQLEELQKTSSLRYVGSLVADFHRNLLKGGVFLYPNGKLRLMYEANPLTFVIKKAGGNGTNGNEDILEIIPKELHERTPLFIGNTKEVDKFTIG